MMSQDPVVLLPPQPDLARPCLNTGSAGVPAVVPQNGASMEVDVQHCRQYMPSQPQQPAAQLAARIQEQRPPAIASQQ
eukprot:6404501-Amphidinium_carterae.1